MPLERLSHNRLSSLLAGRVGGADIAHDSTGVPITMWLPAAVWGSKREGKHAES